MNTSEPFSLQWNHATGAIELRLRGGSRLQFTRDHRAFLWNFLDSLTQLHSHDPKFVDRPMSEAQFRHIYNRWRANANKALDEVLAEMEPAKRDRLSDEQIERLRDNWLAEGNVVIAPLPQVKRDVDLKDLIL